MDAMDQNGANQTKSAGGGGTTNASAHAAPVEEENPACQLCRRRKLKCSREVPACSQCSRLETNCVYNSRQKPGMKSGAVEALNRRVEALEELLRGQGHGDGSYPPPASQLSAQHSLCHVSMLLVKELERIQQNPGLSPRMNSLGEVSSVQTRKRKRRESHDGEMSPPPLDDHEEENLLSLLPDPATLEDIFETYFQKIHPWIPFLHQPRFEQQFSIPNQKRKLGVVLHAMVCATLRFVPEIALRMTKSDIDLQVRRSRQLVLLRAMECPSIAHLQALVVLAFDHLGSGHVEKAWSLIGSLTRTVEYLRLTVEPEEMLQNHPLHKPLSLLETPTCWTEVEERRRLFWNIFLLDRLCSVTTGWSTSLTSDDVHRKLPCDGGLWKREESSDTPYFGIWNKSAAKIGNSIAYIPAHYPTPDHDGHENARSPGAGPGAVDTSKLGAFAYCIEATESLSQVTTFFLQQKVDFKNRPEVGSWLTRFKELDLRLVHWKMFLPQKWKDSNISRDLSLIDMDPNLTLAHITHNTSMILLHQHIAFPPPDWSDIVKLPSTCSAETCFTAAIETVAITKKYLKYKPIDVVNTQFAMCAFVAGRILLVYWRACKTELVSDFFDIVESLKQMSERWQGQTAPSSATVPQDDIQMESLPGNYATFLENMYQKLLEYPKLYLEVLGYSKSRRSSGLDRLLPPLGDIHSFAQSQSHKPDANKQPQHTSPRPTANGYSRTNSMSSSHPGTFAYPPTTQSPDGPGSQVARGKPSPILIDSRAPETWQPLPTSSSIPPGFHEFGHIRNGSDAAYEHVPVDDELTAMSNILLGQQFMEMDRVITFDGTDFAIDMSQWQNIA